MRFLHVLFIVILFFSANVFAQNDEKYQIHLKKAQTSIKLDGILDEAAWKNAQLAKDFFLNHPYDSSFAKLKTEVRLTFDENFIYVAAVCFQKRNTYTTASLKRDFDGGTSDVFTINIDTFKDKVNGFQFSVNPYNVQREGLITLGYETSNYWDNKWYSQVKNYDDYWEVEIAIPFKTLRYKIADGENTWRINFARNCMKANEISSWSPVPRNFRPASLGFAGLLVWDEKPPKVNGNIVLIPYISGGIANDFPRNDENLTALPTTSEFTKGVGMDAKIAVTSSLNLDLTLNPDFSQVEVDKQVTNLSRFELFFPERRQFFLENNDLFGKFGFSNTRPFFSRRIGITYNPVKNTSQKVPIIAGARLSGKLNNNWRIGLMNMQTKEVNFGEDKILPAANYSVAVLQRKVFKRSTIGAIVVNKENSLGNFTEKQKNLFYRDFDETADISKTRYNRMAGLEFNYYSPNSKLETETYYHHTFSAGFEKDAGSFAQFVSYNDTRFEGGLGYFRIGENYRADVGYIPRIGTQNIYRRAELKFNPKSPKISKTINLFGIGTEGNNVYNLSGKSLDYNTDIYVFANSPSGTSFFAGYSTNYTYLLNDFDPTNADYNPNPDKYKNIISLKATTDYSYNYFFAGGETTQKYDLFGSFHYEEGQYYNGNSTTIRGDISYRWQPYGVFTMAGSYTNIKLPKPYNSADYYLIGPKAEFTFSRSVFFSTFFQYNTQTNNTNINSRLQWRFRPVSDFFLVYTDNYFAESIPNYHINTFTPRNRALVLKITYWFNV